MAAKSSWKSTPKLPFLKSTLVTIITGLLALMLTLLCFVNYQNRSRQYVADEMHSQLEHTQNDSILLLQNEVDFLLKLTESIAQILGRIDLKTDDEIAGALEEIAQTSGIVRVRFVTLDGHVYTSFSGYLGQRGNGTSFGDVSLSVITEPMLTDPFYSRDSGKIIFGVITPIVMAGKQGVLISSYDMEDLTSLLKDRFQDEGVEAFITDSNGQMLSVANVDNFRYSYFNRLESATFTSSTLEEIRNAFQTGQDGVAVYERDGQTYHCGYKKLGINDWYVVMTFQESYLQREFAQMQGYGIRLTAELIVIMIVTISIIIAARMKDDGAMRSILERDAMFDGLTRVYNRMTMEDRIRKALKARPGDTVPTMILCDIDNFKQINDSYGHRTGDLVLRECAARLSTIFAGKGTVGRFGGDEFAVFIKDGSDQKALEAQLAELAKDVSILSDDGSIIQVSMSVGVAKAAKGRRSFIELYREADAAMYQEKMARKNAGI